MNNNNKLILYIGGFDLPDRNAAAQRVIANAKALKELGYEIFLIGLTKSNTKYNLSQFESFKYINLPYPCSLKSWINYLTSIKQYLPYIKNKLPHIIIAYNYPSIALNRLRKWCHKNKIQLIGDCSEWYESKGNIFFRIIKALDTNYRMIKIHKKLDGLIVISRFLYDYYSKKMKNVIEIPPLVDLSMEKWTLKDNERDEKFIKIIYAGSPGTGNKDRLDIVLQLLSDIKKEEQNLNFKFVIVGISEKEYKLFFSMPLQKNIKDNIQFKGRLTHIDTLNEIKKADFSFFIRNNNLINNAGFPTKFVESLSCGTPVLTNSTSNIEEYISVGENGFLLDISDYNSLKNSLKNALNTPIEQIHKMKENCYKSHLFDFRKFIYQFESLINNNQ